MAKKKTESQVEEVVETTETTTEIAPEMEAAESVEVAETTETADAEAVEAPAEPVEKVKHERSKKYVEARSQVDRTIAYDLAEAVELAKRTAYSKFEGTLVLHLNLKKELKPIDVAMPFSTGKAVRVALVTDEVVAELEAGTINFDVLIATPDTMKKIVKFARLLGPRGLMPNPKNGTVTTDPDTKRAELEKGTVTLKSEKNAPLVHVRVGKQKQASEEVVANITAVMLIPA